MEQKKHWVHAFLTEITHPLSQSTTLYYDNQSAVAVSKNDQYHPRTKDIDIRYEIIRDIAARGLISVHYCPTEDMPTNMLTKAPRRN